MGLGHINNNLIHIGPALPISNPISILWSILLSRNPKLHFGTIRSSATPICPIWGVSEPSRVDWNLGVSFRKDPTSFHKVWAILHWFDPIQCIPEPFAAFQHHSNKFMSIQIDIRLIGILGFHSQKIWVDSIRFEPSYCHSNWFVLILLKFPLFECRFVSELL